MKLITMSIWNLWKKQKMNQNKEVKFFYWCMECGEYFKVDGLTKEEKAILKNKKFNHVQTVIDVFVCENCR
jgi:hypothetical protein